MLRILTSILLSISLFTGSSQAKDQCDLGHVLKKIVLPPALERSAWSKKAEKFLQDLDYKSPVRMPEKLFGLENNSIAQQNKEALLILKDIESFQMPIEKFADHFRKVYGRTPEREDYFHFYESRNELFKSGMKQFDHEVKKTTNGAGQMWNELVQQQLKVSDKLLESAKKEKDLEAALDKLNQFGRKMVGSLTEIRTGVSLDGVKKISFELKESPALMERMEDKLSQYKNNLQALDKDFPKIGRSSMPVKGRDYSVEERLQEIRKWIASKEIDVVRNENGKTKWVEVKRNAIHFNESNFSSAGFGKKSYRYQINETKEIIQFLGLENEIQLEYLATGGMDESLKASLEVDGIKVLKP
jgi:hypothetical protein